jgi:NTP pyrophosphatase (non-canonical NTP hydrolase)
MQINEFARMNYERSMRNDRNRTFNWEYFLIALAGECGELLNNLKKIKRGDFSMDKGKMAEEAADAITYAFLLLSSLGADPEKAILEKFEKVNKRLAEGGFHVRV